MSEPKFQVGDIVLLRSGGPSMVIDMVRRISSDRQQLVVYDVCWFNDRQLLHAAFAEPELIKP